MTTTIKVTSHNYPAMIETVDAGRVSDTRVITPSDGEQTFYCTTSREIRVTDLGYDDPRVPKTAEKPSE